MDDPMFLILMPVHNGAGYMEGAILDLLAQTEDRWKLVIADLSSGDESLRIAGEWSKREPDRIACISPEDLRPTSDLEDTQKQLFVVARERWANLGADASRGIREEGRLEYFLLLEPMYHYDENLLSTLRDSVHRQKSDLIIYGMEEDFVNAKGDLVDYDLRISDTSFYCRGRMFHGSETDADDGENRSDPGNMPIEKSFAFAEGEQAEPDTDCEREPFDRKTDYERQLSDQARTAFRAGHQGAIYWGEENLREVRRELEEEGLLITASNKAYRIDYIEAMDFCPFCHETEEEMDEQLTLSGIRTNVKLVDAAGSMTVLGEALAIIYLDAGLLDA